jgi:hypothetical protein
MSEKAFQAGRFAVPKSVEIWDVRIDRRLGDAACFMVSPDLLESHDFPTCQFTDPEVLRVTTPRGATYYRFALTPGVAQPATVSFPRGEPRCVQAARFIGPLS